MTDFKEHRVQVLFRSSEILRKNLQVRAIREGRDQSDILNDALIAYLKEDAPEPTEADRYCAKLRKMMGKKSLSAAEEKAREIICYLLDLWIKIS